VGYRRGFKAEAAAIATEVRGELGLGPLDRLDPRRLADQLAIPIYDLSSLAAEAPAVAHLRDVEPHVFSAVTVFAGRRRAIVHNDAHAPVRQNSNLAHELSHGLLLHPPTPPLDDMGCRVWDQDVEDEAGWLAGCLLVTEQAALALARQRLSLAGEAERLGVSEQMLRYRINGTGAAVRVRRARAAGGSIG
jgi:Zn-dependent peptidase ImmA (M78 family)